MHHHHHHHEHGSGHSHGVTNYNRAFAIGIGLNIALVVGQAAFGFMSHSLALLADAGHNLSDVLGLILAWAASVLATRRPTARRTYGMGRASILAALANAAFLLVACGAIGLEAIRRFQNPEPVADVTVAWVAAAAVLINGATAMMFMRGQEDDLNIRGAFLHMAADAGVSLAVVFAALGIHFTGRQWLDPAASLLVVAVIVFSTWSLLKDSVDLAMDAVPRGIDIKAVRECLLELPGVTGLHDLHVWALSTTENALTAHVVRMDPAQDERLYQAAYDELKHHFGIDHATLQLECDDRCAICHLAPDDVV